MTPEQRADAVMDAFYKADLAHGARTVLLTLIAEAVRAAENEAVSRYFVDQATKRGQLGAALKSTP